MTTLPPEYLQLFAKGSEAKRRPSASFRSTRCTHKSIQPLQLDSPGNLREEVRILAERSPSSRKPKKAEAITAGRAIVTSVHLVVSPHALQNRPLVVGYKPPLHDTTPHLTLHANATLHPNSLF